MRPSCTRYGRKLFSIPHYPGSGGWGFNLKHFIQGWRDPLSFNTRLDLGAGQRPDLTPSLLEFYPKLNKSQTLRGIYLSLTIFNPSWTKARLYGDLLIPRQTTECMKLIEWIWGIGHWIKAIIPAYCRTWILLDFNHGTWTYFSDLLLLHIFVIR